MARDSQAALVALNRFGFGARGGASGDLINAASDPRGFVKAELARANGGRPQEFIAELVSHFGADRVMWGSDFCQTHDRTYAELVALARDAFGDLPRDAEALCLGGTAARLWPSLVDRGNRR